LELRARRSDGAARRADRLGAAAAEGHAPAMAISNKTDAFPNLSRRVDLPAPKEAGNEGGRRLRRAASGETA